MAFKEEPPELTRGTSRNQSAKPCLSTVGLALGAITFKTIVLNRAGLHSSQAFSVNSPEDKNTIT
jgi:hypothetical protein